jgi:hypothetical protein
MRLCTSSSATDCVTQLQMTMQETAGHMQEVSSMQDERCGCAPPSLPLAASPSCRCVGNTRDSSTRAWRILRSLCGQQCASAAQAPDCHDSSHRLRHPAAVTQAAGARDHKHEGRCSHVVLMKRRHAIRCGNFAATI